MSEMAILERLDNLELRVQELEATQLAEWTSLGQLVREFQVIRPNLKRNTLRDYLIRNFEPEVDFRKNGIIEVAKSAVPRLRSHYVK